jgi:Ca2+/Na+ antiporter
LHVLLQDTHYQLSSAAERELFVHGDEEEAEEEEEIPEDFVDLPPEEQQTRIKFRAFWMMGLGTLLVVLFSDPLVEVLSEVGARTHISPFYISFVLAPLASNASELFASFNYAQKKTTKTIEIALTTLEGAGCMNNTFCLGIFMMLIFTQGLAWEFSAETLAILFVEICVAAFAMKTTHTTFDAFCILALYPISLFLVAGLEAAGYK